ncbi:MAG: sulfite exporter TauE/SafE family protein [Candidatus Methanodesulfokora washburnensis]
MDVIMVSALLGFGFLAGVVGGLLGTGGCVIMLPALVFLFSYNLPVAIGTTVTAVIVTATSGAIGHIRMRNVDYRTAKIVAIAGALGAALGCYIFTILAGNVGILSLILGLAFLYVSIRMIYEGVKRSVGAATGNEIPGSANKKGAIGFIIGVLTGIIGLGGGYALVPSFIYLLNAPVKLAVGTSLASFISMAAVSGIVKIVQGYVDIIAALSLGAGTAVGAQVGAKLVPKTPAWAIKLLFGLVFLYVSLKFIFSAFGIRI